MSQGNPWEDSGSCLFCCLWFALKGRSTGDRRSILWQFSYWKLKSNTGKGGLKENIFLLVTGSCFEDQFDSLSCLRSQVHWNMFCFGVWSWDLSLSISEGSLACSAWSHPQIVLISLEIKKKSHLLLLKLASLYWCKCVTLTFSEQDLVHVC